MANRSRLAARVSLRIARGNPIGDEIVQRSKGSAPGFLFRLPEEDGPPPFVTSFGSTCAGTGVAGGAGANGTVVPSPQPIVKLATKAASVEKLKTFLNRI
jgi:hypothetical protein